MQKGVDFTCLVVFANKLKLGVYLLSYLLNKHPKQPRQRSNAFMHLEAQQRVSKFDQ